MPTTLLAVIAAALVALAGAVAFIAYRLHRASTPTRATPLSGSPADDVDPIIAGPPQVRGDTVRDWLMYHTRGRKSWADAVAEFYRRAAADPEIASYFAGVDLAQLQRHFTAAIVIVTSKGLSAKTVLRMAEAHRDIRDERGRPITGEVYDRVVGVLAQVLLDMGVPEDAVGDLAGVVAPLRRAIVAAP